MSSEPGMCPQRLFTNTKLFTIAGKRNPTRARSSPDLAGGAGPRLRGEGGSLGSSPGGAAVRPGRGAAGPARSAGTAAAPPLSSRRRRALAAAALGPEGSRRPQLFPATPRALLSPFSSPSRPPLRFPVSNPAPGKLPAPKTSTSKAEVSDKKLPLPTTRRLQPATDFYFPPFKYLFSGFKNSFFFLNSPTLSLPFIAFGDVIFVFIFSAGPTLICRNGSSLSSSTPRAGNLTFPSWARSSLGSEQDLLPLPAAETSQKTPPAVAWKMDSPKSR